MNAPTAPYGAGSLYGAFLVSPLPAALDAASLVKLLTACEALASDHLASRRRRMDRSRQAGRPPHDEDVIRADRAEYVRSVIRQARPALAELVAADREYDAALAAYNACAPVRPWHSPAVTRELADYRRKARERLNAAKARRAAAVAGVGGAP